MSYRYRRDYDPYYDYYDNYYDSYRRPGYYTTRDGRWPATYRHYEMPTKSTTARNGVYDHRGWYSDSDYWRRPTTTTRRPGTGSRYYADANVWDVMNHHRDYYRGYSPSRATNGVYYDYHGRAHRKLDGRLPPLR